MAVQFYSLYNPTSGLIVASFQGDSNDVYGKSQRAAARPGIAVFDATELLDPKLWMIVNGQKVTRPRSNALYILRNNAASPGVSSVLTEEGLHYDVHVQGGDLVSWENIDGNGLTLIQGPDVDGVSLVEIADWTFAFKTPPGPGVYEFTFTSGALAAPTKVKVVAHQVLADDNWL